MGKTEYSAEATSRYRMRLYNAIFALATEAGWVMADFEEHMESTYGHCGITLLTIPELKSMLFSFSDLCQYKAWKRKAA